MQKVTFDPLLENSKHQKSLIHAKCKWCGTIAVHWLLMLKTLAQWEWLACWDSESLVVPSAAGFPGSPSYATAALVFLEYKGSWTLCTELIVTDYHHELKTELYWKDVKLPGKLQFQFEQLLQPWNSHCGLWSWMKTWPCETSVAKGTHHGMSAWRAPLGSLYISRPLAIKMTLRQHRGLIGIMNLAFLQQGGKQSFQDASLLMEPFWQLNP